MANRERKTDEQKVEFDAAGEVISYVSLDQAVLLARQLVSSEAQRYRERLGWEGIVWSEKISDQREDSYRVVLEFRRPARGLNQEQTGEEEFIYDLTGDLQFRQVLVWPEGAGPTNWSSPATQISTPNTFESYLSKVLSRLKDDGFECQSDVTWQHYAYRLVASKRKSTFSGMYFVFAELATIDTIPIRAFSRACVEWVRETYGGFNFTCLPVTLANGVESDVVDAIERETPSDHKGATVFPVIYDFETNALYHYDNTSFLGWANWSRTPKAFGQLLKP
ncbi:MAG: hypothetical protein IH956_10205 [Chloroflexi bacterium]|nr:hypothetical protein [Chloroflexota bacterium]